MDILAEEKTGIYQNKRAATPHGLDVARIRQDFPVLGTQVYGKPLAYLDNAATSQKPQVVIDTIRRYYEAENSNIHRGVYYLSERATEAYENAREKVRETLNAASVRQIIFTRGATESINLVAATFGRTQVQAGDEILITAMEHHSNIVPWQILCEEKGAKLKVAPINRNGEVIQDEYEKLLTEKTRLVALVYVSNSLGTVNPVKKMIARAHDRGIPVLIDGAQSMQHLKNDVQELGCDFFAFSGHKAFGPTGIGILYGREELLEAMPPYQAGGEMIKTVTFEKTTYNDIPHKFEAGTPNIAGAIGLGKALAYLEGIGLEAIQQYEAELLAYATEKLQGIDRLQIIGQAGKKSAIVSFVVDGVHPHDIGTMLDREGIAVRAGHHCTQPVMDFFNVPATSRASFAFYNTKEEIDRLAEALHKIIGFFS